MRGVATKTADSLSESAHSGYCDSNAQPETTRIASAHGPCQGATRLLRFAAALRVTRTFRCGLRWQLWPGGGNRSTAGNQADGVAVYHLKVGFGSRAGGQSASAKDDIEREGRYTADGEEREHVEHGHMPAWAQDDPHAYWQAADAHERANGRLYSEVQFALPRELDASGRRALAGAFAERVCGGERLPSTLALHKGEAETPDKPDNPHAHLMFSERGNDGIARSEEQWFKRHNPTAPERGGARKSRAAKAGDWLDTTRQAWEQTANRALEQAGRAERIDGRSLPDRRDAAHREGDLERAAELSREPNVHRGPGQYLKDRGRASATVAQAEAVEQRTATARAERDADRRQVERLEQEIAAVGARLQETYDRVRRAVDARVQQAGRAIRAGAERAVRAGRELGKAGAAVSRAVRTGADAAGRSGRELGRASATVGRAVRTGAESAHRVGEYTRRARREIDQQLQDADGRFNRALSVIHVEAEQKRRMGTGRTA